MKKLVFLFIIMCLQKAYKNEELKSMLKPVITDMYRQIAKENLILKDTLVNVKKGKKKYDLLIFEEPGGCMKFNLGRHWEGVQEGVLN